MIDTLEGVSVLLERVGAVAVAVAVAVAGSSSSSSRSRSSSRSSDGSTVEDIIASVKQEEDDRMNSRRNVISNYQSQSAREIRPAAQVESRGHDASEIAGASANEGVDAFDFDLSGV